MSDYIEVTETRRWVHRCSACSREIKRDNIMVEFTHRGKYGGGYVAYYHVDCIPDHINTQTENIEYNESEQS